MEHFSQKLQNLKDKSRYRALSLPSGIDLSSNDYLGLMDHPALKKAALGAVEAGVGFGSGGSRLLRGHGQAHQDLEEFAAAYYGSEKALYFANGFMANYALFTSLPSRHDVILFDSLIHASAKDGIHASHAKGVKIPHNDLNVYEDAMKRFRDRAETLWISVESVYSMDGDFAPLRELYELACRYGAILVVDEAHGTGVWGETGKGCTEGFSQDNLIVLHTCGKALGSAGGLICASRDIVHMLVNVARPFIYSTAPPPIQAYVTQKAIEISGSEEGAQRRQVLHRLCKKAHNLFGGYGSQIIPVILGDDGRAVRVARRLQAAGYDIRAVRPPTVPEGSARLRLSLNVHLSPVFLDELFAEMEDVLGHVQAAE